MAAAQSVLYSTNKPTQFDAREFIKAVCQTAEQMFPVKVNVDCAETLFLSNDVAMPLALILNELLTNAVKHGLSRGDGATVLAGLVKETDAFCLFVEDSGPGFDLETVQERSSGIRLVQGLTRQLGGRLEVVKHPSRCAVYFG